MRQDVLDYINFLARDLPKGSVNSDRLADDVIFMYEKLHSEYSSAHNILLELACFLATKNLIEDHLERNNLPNPVKCEARHESASTTSITWPATSFPPTGFYHVSKQTA